MNKPIARITRENHLNTLIGNLPLFTCIYGIQCALAHFVFFEVVDPGLFAATLGACIISLLSFLYVYDRYQHLVVFEDKLLIHFELTKAEKVIAFSDIKDVQAPKEECEFASLSLIMQDGSQYDLHFIDYPLSVKNFLMQKISENMGDEETNLAA